MRMIMVVLVCSFGLIFLSGHTQCSHNRYEIEMLPSGQEIVRTLTCVRSEPVGDRMQATEIEAAEAERIASLYSEKLDSEASPAIGFRDTFLDTTPADVGGAGRYLHLFTLPGTASAYTERFRGDDDQAAQLEGALRAADILLGYVHGWLSTRIPKHPGKDRLLGFLDGRLKADFHNLIVYAALSEQLQEYDPDAPVELGVRVLQVLVERGYLTMDDLPAWTSAFDRAVHDDRATELMARVQRLIAKKMGVPGSEPLPAALGFLADADRAWESFGGYLETTEAYKTQLASWESRHKSQPKVPRPAPRAVLEELLKDLVPFDFGSRDLLSVTLKIGIQPFSTNGTWNQAAGRLEWIDKSIRGPSGLPTFLYAFWSEPDHAFQKNHFGSTLLSGKNLGEYVLWRRGLNTAEGIEWDDFLRSLRPGPDLIAKIEGFCFSHERSDRPESSSCDLAKRPLLLMTP